MGDEQHPPLSKLEDSHSLAQAIVDTIREPLLVLDKDLRVVAASRSFFLTFDMNRQDVQGRPIYALGNGQWDIPELRLLLDRILPQHTVMEDYEVELVFSTIGRRTMMLNARTVFYEGQGQALILLSIEDVTQRRTHEQRLAQLLSEKETLLQEMQHRVANSLQIIASILLLKARTVQSDETRLHLQDAHRRVMSVAAVQQQLQASAHGEQFPIAPYLSHLCETLAASMIGEGRPIRVEVRAGAADVSSTEAVSIGLIVTELVINALKHAFADGAAGGRILVTYGASGKGWGLTVRDNGVGAAEEGGAKITAGLGTSIVQALAKQLEPTIDLADARPGTRISIVHKAAPARLGKTPTLRAV
jgi:chemotaxis protein methyltransferase CheR